MQTSSANARRKVLIIGLDGVTFDLIRPWAEAGKLPVMARLMQQGAWGPLRSTTPAHSAPAWTSFATGVNPGKHGVYFFLRPSRDEQYFRPVSAESISGRRFWEVADDQGFSVSVLNVPLTYPLRPVRNGYAIAGIFAPNNATAFSTPALHDEVMAASPDYVVEADVSRNRAVYLEEMMAGMRARRQAAEYLLRERPTELSIVVFRMIDSVMHYFWADLDPDHPLRAQIKDRPLIPDALPHAYQLLDEAVGGLIDAAGPNTNVLIMSDHGFRAEYKRFAVNRWLREQGLLTLKAGRGALPVVGKTIKRLGLTRLAKRALTRMTGSSWQAAVWSIVDWSRTQVVYGPGPAFYVNMKDRDAHGIVTEAQYEALCDRIVTEFKKVIDPETGLAVVADVFRRDDIYVGDGKLLAPDLIPEPAEYTHPDGRRWGYGFEPFPGAPTMFSAAERYAGAHSPDGILIASGPDIAAGQLAGLSITDLAPTALYALGAAVPEAMDGRVRSDLFLPAFTAANPPQYDDIDISGAGKAGQVMDLDDENVVESRLRDLGYL